MSNTNNEPIYLSVPELSGNELKYVKQALDSSWVSTRGPYVKEFEDKFAAYLGAQHAVATMNGTAALHMALICLGIQNEDEVLVPSLTFIATVNPVRYCGAKPVFVDCEYDTWGMDPDRIRQKITKKTKAIMVTHLYGHPVRIDEVVRIAREHNLKVVEDATHSLGSKAYGEFTGTFGNIGCFSFNSNKLITTGGGGMLVTDDEAIAKRALFLTNQAKQEGFEYYHPEIGYNYRMVNILAAVGVAQLERLDEFISRKRWIVQRYRTLFAEVPELEVLPEQDWAFSNCWMSSVLLAGRLKDRKTELIKFLLQKKIFARPFFVPIHTLPPYKHDAGDDLPVTRDLYARGVNLPCSHGITEEQIQRVADEIKNWITHQ